MPLETYLRRPAATAKVGETDVGISRFTLPDWAKGRVQTESNRNLTESYLGFDGAATSCRTSTGVFTNLVLAVTK